MNLDLSPPVGDDERAARTLEQFQDSFVEQHVASRTEQWSKAIEAELQDLVVQASLLRKEISGAKTNTKKKYYEKKFAKVSAQVRQMVTALQQVEAKKNLNTNTAKNESTTTTV
jgi:hypothetical protein